MEITNISLPDSLHEFVVTRVSEGGYGSVSDYVSALIRADQMQKAKEILESELLKGLASGPASPMTDEDWAYLRKRATGLHLDK